MLRWTQHERWGFVLTMGVIRPTGAGAQRFAFSGRLCVEVRVGAKDRWCRCGGCCAPTSSVSRVDSQGGRWYIAGENRIERTRVLRDPRAAGFSLREDRS